MEYARHSPKWTPYQKNEKIVFIIKLFLHLRLPSLSRVIVPSQTGSLLRAFTTVLPGRPHWLRGKHGLSPIFLGFLMTWSLALVALKLSVKLVKL